MGTDCTVIHGNAMDRHIGLLSWKPIEHVITDPPFAPHVHFNHMVSGSRRGRHERQDVGSKDLGFEHLTGEARIMCAEQIAAVTLRWAIVFCDAESASSWMSALGDAGMEPIRIGVWTKTNVTPQFTGDRPGSFGEAFVVAHATGDTGKPTKKRWNGGGRPARYDGPMDTRNRRHPTQKPLWLMESIVRDYTDPGETIADPFAGSGTTLVAAKRCGRRAVGWEINRDHWETARKRISATSEQFDLFGRTTI